MAIGLPANAYLKAPVFSTVVRMITIKGSYVGNRQDGDEAIDFFARGLINAPYKVVPLKELPHVYDLMGMSSSDLILTSFDPAMNMANVTQIQRRAKLPDDMS